MESSPETLTVASLGAGYFARFHYQAWHSMDGVELIGLCDQDLARAQALVQGAATPVFESLQAMLDSASPDILDIVTPPPTHAAVIAQALEAGVQTIICQKPFCQSLSEAIEMVELAATHNARLIVHENFRFQPWYRAIAAALQAGRIGTPQQAAFRLRTGDGQGPEAYLDRQPYFQTMKRLLVHETAVHFIDTFQYLFGPVNAVYADLRRLNPVIAGEDAGYIVFDFDNEVQAVFDGNRHLDHAADNHRLTLGEGLFEGTGGTLKLRGNGTVSLRSFGEKVESVLLAERPWAGFAGDCVRAFQLHVVSHLRSGTPLETEACDYLSTLRIEAVIYQSAAEGRKIECT